jgi:hypothetical protein
MASEIGAIGGGRAYDPPLESAPCLWDIPGFFIFGTFVQPRGWFHANLAGD